MQMGGGPRPVTDSWEHMWWDNLAWKRWKTPRTGPAFPQDMYWQVRRGRSDLVNLHSAAPGQNACAVVLL